MARRRFVVVGLGNFGHHMARSLYEMGHDVLVIDRRQEALDAIRPYCSRTCLADAADQEELEQAGAAAAEVGIVAIGTEIDSSILATVFLKELGVKEIVAKAVTRDHGRILSHIGATEVVHPEWDAAARLAHRLVEPTVLDRMPFLENHALVELRLPRALWGKTLAESRLRSAHGLAVLLTKRREGNRWVVSIPKPLGVLAEGDVLVVLGRTEDVEAFRTAYPDR